MYCSTSLTRLPVLPRLPRGLVAVLILSLLFHTCPLFTSQPMGILPSFTIKQERSLSLRLRRRRSKRHALTPWRLMTRLLPRLLVRLIVLASLLHLSGWTTVTPLAWGLLIIPVVQALSTVMALRCITATHHRTAWFWSSSLHRGYQGLLIVLLLSVLQHGLSHFHGLTEGGWPLMGLSVSVLSADHATEIKMEQDTPTRYHITLRGTFELVWEPRDNFEKWMLILFLRRLTRRRVPSPFLRLHHLADAFDVAAPNLRYWIREVETYGWHILSDRYRHQIHSALPDASLSRAILKAWVPTFWLSAWEIRERLIQAQIIPDRDTLAVEALHALAKHTGFAQVRDLLLERFNLQHGQLIARETWWLRELLALNERLIAKLERGELLLPQELVEIEPLRLKAAEKPGDSTLSPLAASLKSALFKAPPTPETPVMPVHCTYCGSDRVAPKSKQPRRKTVFDEFGELHVIDVVRYYCLNPACAYHTFTHFPAGVLPHSCYPIQVRLLAIEVYDTLLATYRRSARLFEVTAATLYHWVNVLGPAAECLAAYLGVVRTSGVIGVDDKWILVCSPSAVRPHGRRKRAVWRYAYFAVDVYSYDLLALDLYPEHNDEAARLILLELKAKGLRPRVVVTDLDPAYGRVLPQVFPTAIHHECIFHALQNASAQLTRVYGRYYLERVPASVPLHEAITTLFHAQTQKTVRQRFADLMALRETYVAQTPEVACVFDSLARHFPKLVNAIENPLIPRTNNATELVIRRFDQHYQAMCGFDTFESAQRYLRVFEVVYRLTPFADDARSEIRGKSPLELAGYDLRALPLADFFTQRKLPLLPLQGAEVVPMT
jgi:hypothetical protein